MISVIVATCFGVFIGLGNTSLLYYAAKVSDSVQGKGIWKVQSLRRSADNVGEMPQLASIPGCQSGGSQEIGRAQNSAILATAELLQMEQLTPRAAERSRLVESKALEVRDLVRQISDHFIK